MTRITFRDRWALLAATLVTLALAVIAFACGGGGDSKEAATIAPTGPVQQVHTSTPRSTPGVTPAQTTVPPECSVPEAIQQVTEAKPCAVAQTPSGGSDGARVTLNNILDPYVDTSILQATPAASMRFIAIEATVQARPGVQHHTKYSNFTLVDMQGNIYQPGIEVGVPGAISLVLITS